MIINLSPVYSDNIPELTASVSGSILTINGEAFDFGILGPGHMLPAAAISSPHFAGSVVRHDSGELEVTLLFMHPSNASENMRFPVPITIGEGVVPFPINTTPVEQEEPVEEPVEVPND